KGRFFKVVREVKFEKTEIDFVLVGDSLGNVIQGAKSTLTVTVEHIAYHVKCVASKLKSPLLVADMPFASAGVSRASTMNNATILMQAGAEAVKIEGASKEILEDIGFLTAHGVPVMGHIGLQPQSVNAIGGYKLQGKDESAKNRLKNEAKKLQDAGCFAIVLELVDAGLAQEISQSIKIPTIGIGAGNYCDGNILVLQDMLGMDSQFKPKFLKHYANFEEIIHDAVNQYCADVVNKKSEPQ
ncbi:MAG: 3-methyl-2-oxobutanoate hydroxymethyltransferase, partial [Bdellovibrionota bacterium]